jgi:hypothetical protein
MADGSLNKVVRHLYEMAGAPASLDDSEARRVDDGLCGRRRGFGAGRPAGGRSAKKHGAE